MLVQRSLSSKRLLPVTDRECFTTNVTHKQTNNYVKQKKKQNKIENDAAQSSNIRFTDGYESKVKIKARVFFVVEINKLHEK